MREIKEPRHWGAPTILMSVIAVLVVLTVAVLVLRPQGAKAPAADIASGATPDATASAKAPTSVLGNTVNKNVRLGLFLGTDTQGVAKFQKWLGVPVRDVVDFGPRQTWSDIVNPPLSEWIGTNYRLIYAVPMLPNDTPTSSKLATMKAGARGEYNHYFTQLGQRLVSAGEEDAVLRIGWEFNIESWPWGIKDYKVYRAFFRQVATTLRAVPGSNFKIDWNVNNGFNPNDGANYYPGDKYVDYIGVDAYDIDSTVYPYPKTCDSLCKQKLQARAWNEVIFGGERGLNFWAAFAGQHKKPMSFPEWGLWDRFEDSSGGGDNPYFVQQMHDFIAYKPNNVAYAAYFDLSSDDGDHNLNDDFPVSAKLFKQLFSD